MKTAEYQSKMSAFFSNKAFSWNIGYFVTMNNSQPITSLREYKTLSDDFSFCVYM